MACLSQDPFWARAHGMEHMQLASKVVGARGKIRVFSIYGNRDVGTCRFLSECQISLLDFVPMFPFYFREEA
jgi:hypothetical protein